MSFFAFKKILLTTSAICGISLASTANAAIEVGTWADFKNAITSGTETDIILTGNIVVDTVTSLYINRDINISSKGDNKFTISAAETSRFPFPFIKNNSGKMTLSNIEMKGFNSIYYFGVISAPIYSNGGLIENITNTSFISNTSGGNGGAIYNDTGKIVNISASTFANNTANGNGGALYNNSIIEYIASNFTNNGTYRFNSHFGLSKGGAVYNNGTISKITSIFTGNYASSNANERISVFGGALYNNNTIEKIISNFVNNYVFSDNNVAGGAIYNNNIISSISGIFIGNYAKSENSEAKGGAIYNNSNIMFKVDADNDVLFKDNYVDDILGKRYEAIYNSGTINFWSNNNGSYTFYDYINNDGGTMTFSGDGTGTFNLFNDIKGTGNITFDSDYAFNMLNDTINVIQANNLTINSIISMAVDVDLANATMDSLVASSAAGTGEIIINNMNLISEATADKTIIPFITAGTNNTAVSSAISKIDTGSLTYYYNVSYADGNFTFDKMQRESNEVAEDVGVPAVSAGVQQTQSALNALLANRNIYLNMGLASGDTTRPTTWAKAFGSKDSVELKNSYNSIDTQFYGIVGGVDSRTFTYDNGINAVYGIYAAYMGSNQKQNSVKVTQDGGYLGVSADFTKSGVFSRFTAHGGYIANEAKTAWGNDKFDIWTASVSNKTGYEIDLGEYTLKPALYASYMYINTENYTSKAGAKLKNHTKNVFEVTPEVKLAKDFGTGLEGYAKVAYTWNFYQGGKVTADDVLLPKMSVKPYVEYGVGLEKDWSEEEWNPKDITSYAEINRHDGGRTGWDINAGLKFQF